MCNVVKHWKKFLGGSLDHRTRKTHLRCKDCLHCHGCHKEKKVEQFNGNSKTCTTCCTLWTCKPCGQSFPADQFDAKNLDKHLERNRTDPLVCNTCHADGYRPEDTTDYPCELCGAKGCGQFETTELQNYKKSSRYQKVQTGL